MEKNPKILVTGGGGLLAHALARLQNRDWDWLFFSHKDFDLLNGNQMAEQLDKHKPLVVINTAAYNLVDRCEVERDFSWAVNAQAPAELARLCALRQIRLVHYGTDYVFDGSKKAPYLETDAPAPLNHYAEGKLAGERAVLKADPAHLVLRTSWIFDWHPTQSKTFVHTILKAAREGRRLQATTDQVSVPTHASDLAGWTLALIQNQAHGLFHAVNDEGVSRFQWTQAILDESASLGLIPSIPSVEPVLSSHFNATMRRPDYTVLSNSALSRQLGRPLGSWRSGLRKMLATMK